MSTVRGIRASLPPDTVTGRLKGSGAAAPVTVPQLAQALLRTTPALSSVKQTTAGVAVETSRAISAEALLLPAAGVVDGSDAASGNIGEYLSSTVLVAGAVSLTSGTDADIATLLLPAGDWDVWGTVAYVPAGVTTLTTAIGWINETSATLPPWPNGGAISTWVGSVNGISPALAISPQRISTSAPTTLYLGTHCSFGGTLSAIGVVQARRAR